MPACQVSLDGFEWMTIGGCGFAAAYIAYVLMKIIKHRGSLADVRRVAAKTEDSAPAEDGEVNPRNVFILGAGFTRAIHSAAPLNDDLLRQIVGSGPDSSPLGRAWAQYGEANIEVLLTKFDLDLSSGKNGWTGDDRNAINAQLASYMQRFRFAVDTPWLHPFLSLVEDNDVIVSLNYDCALEGFLDYHGAWSPKGGYVRIYNALDDSLPENSRNIRILKVHGSESFRLAHFIDKPEFVSVAVEINPDLFPRSGAHSRLGGGIDSRPYIIAPSFVKQFALELDYLILDAIRFAREAENLVLIGCGVRPEDNHLQLVLTSFLKTPRWKQKKLFVVSPGAADVAERIRRFFSRKIFEHGNLVCLTAGLKEALPDLCIRLKQS